MIKLISLVMTAIVLVFFIVFTNPILAMNSKEKTKVTKATQGTKETQPSPSSSSSKQNKKVAAVPAAPCDTKKEGEVKKEDDLFQNGSSTKELEDTKKFNPFNANSGCKIQ